MTKTRRQLRVDNCAQTTARTLSIFSCVPSSECLQTYRTHLDPTGPHRTANCKIQCWQSNICQQ